jgi:hypothetical protein
VIFFQSFQFEILGKQFLIQSCIKMSFSNVPLRNPGRYFEQFVKVVQPISGGGQAASSYANTPTMAVTSSFVTHNGSGGNNSQIAANGNGQSNMFSSYGSQNDQIVEFK